VQKLLIDTDIGSDIDDALAIAFALRRPELEVVGITTCAGDVVARARLAMKLLRVAGRTDVPVAAGYEFPLATVGPQTWRDYLDGKGLGRHRLTHTAYVKDGDPEATCEVRRDAVQLIIETVEAHPGEVGIVVIGPYTNVAAALAMQPSIAPKIKFIAMMGGELAIHRLEHNIKSDAQAAGIVFESPVEKMLGTWSVTRGFIITEDLCEKIKSQGNELCAALGEMIDLWWPYKGGKPGPVMYDVAAVIWAFDRKLYTTEKTRVTVETRGDVSTGFTTRMGGEPNMLVTSAIDADGVRDLYMDTILAG